MQFGEQLPNIYAQFLPRPLLDARIEETKATCHDCLEARRGKYSAQLKCCTYHPFLPNFLVGAALRDPATADSARRALLGKIEQREFILPIGIVPSVKHQVRFNQRKEGEFGNREDWLCPYYNREQNQCGLWQHRGAVCTSYYCESSYGKRGQKLWQKMSDYLTYVEMAILEEAMVEMGYSPRQMSDSLHYLNRFEATAEELKEPALSPAKMKSLWGDHHGGILEFYDKCYLYAAKWKRTDFRVAMGEQGMGLQKDLLQVLSEVV